MNNVFVSTILALVAGVLGYIAWLRSQVSSHQRTIDSLKSKESEREWTDKLKDQGVKVDETVKDYRDARDKFKREHGSGEDEPS